MKLTGKILYLTDDAVLLRRQLDGDTTVTVELTPDTPLHYGVNTDLMISGGACTLGFTGEILGPWFLEHFKEVVAKDDIRMGGFQVIVGGDAYGSGSSREVAVVAHQGAGIELIVAKSFQRIFQENCVFSGMPITTDMSVIDRLQRDEEVDTAAFADELPPFFAMVARAGGLLPYANVWLSGQAEPWYDTRRPWRAMNMAEKIIAQNTWAGDSFYGVRDVRPGDQVLCRTGFRGMHEYTTAMVMDLYGTAFGLDGIVDPANVACFADHFVLIGHEAVPASVKAARLASSTALAEGMFQAAEAFGLRVHGPGREFPAGVCHRIVVEDYAVPGTIVVLTDSHSCTAGVLNTFAFGVGSTAMAFALRTGTIPVTVPHVVRINISGKAGLVTPKDLILHIIGDPYFREERWRTSPTDTCVLEFHGDGLDQWNVDELSVLTNMCTEGGLMTGIVAPCASLRHFLREERGQDYAAQMVEADDDAEYVRVIDIDLAEVPITVATPGDSRNRCALAEVGEVAVHNVVIASCTGGSFEDLCAASDVLRKRRIKEGVRVTVTPSSQKVYDQAEEAGVLALFRNLGAVVTPPGCGSCIGNGPGIPQPGETTASTTNRNFDRRMGAPGPVYLVSPAVAAASAVTGMLTDPRDLPPVER